MQVDISYPTEFRAFEQVEYSDGRRIAYLSFINESDETIVAISGCFTMLNENGKVMEQRRVSFQNLKVNPREAYICNLPLNDYPMFTDAYMSVEAISYAMRDSWSMDTNPSVPYESPEPITEIEKAELVNIAGQDAVCFPQKHGSHWICVCGRYNKNEWNVCSRCYRIKYKVFRYCNKETVMFAYQNRLAKHEKSSGPNMRRLAYDTGDSIHVKEERLEKIEQIVLLVTIFVLVGALLIWGFTQLSKEKPNQENAITSITRSQSPRSTPGIDYLEPL